MKKSLLFPFLLFPLLCIGQGEPKLTNQDVLELAKAGLSPVIIISKIKTSATDFQVDTESLKALMDAKLADEIIAAMVEKQAAPTKNIVYGMANAEHGSLGEIKGKSRIFLVTEDPRSREIIVKALQKTGRFQLVNRREEAEFALSFAIGRIDAGSNIFLGTAHNIVVVGEMQAYTYLPVAPADTVGRIRILWQKRKTQDFSGGMTFSRHPATNAVNSFISEFKKLK